MKFYFLIVAGLVFAVSCKTNQGIGATSDDTNTEYSEGLEDPLMSVDLTTYLKRFPGISVRGQGMTATITIRGVSSLNISNEPLMILDGMQFPSYEDLYSVINTASIKRIEVLKNPDEIGIYGVRGANGVIRITTKKS